MHSHKHCCCGETIIITYSEYVSVAIVTQHAKRLDRVILSSVACQDVQYFFTLSHINGTIFGRMLLNIKCVFWFYLQRFSEMFLIPRRIKRETIINVLRYSCKVAVILVRF